MYLSLFLLILLSALRNKNHRRLPILFFLNVMYNFRLRREFFPCQVFCKFIVKNCLEKSTKFFVDLGYKSVIDLLWECVNDQSAVCYMDKSRILFIFMSAEMKNLYYLSIVKIENHAYYDIRVSK